MNISIELYAGILLVVRLISMWFMYKVLRKQWSLFQFDIPAHIRNYRRVLFILALVIFFGNVTPALIDVVTIMQSEIRQASTVTLISVLYTFSASGTALASAFLIWLLYRLAAEEAQTIEEEKLREHATVISD